MAASEGKKSRRLMSHRSQLEVTILPATSYSQSRHFKVQMLQVTIEHRLTFKILGKLNDSAGSKERYILTRFKITGILRSAPRTSGYSKCRQEELIL